LTVSNTGTEPLTSVVVGATEPACCDFYDASVSAPTVVSGNTDAVLDPGEVWTFTALGENIHGSVDITATAVTAWGATVSATDRLDFGGVILLYPIIGSIRPAVDHVAAVGDPMDWTVEFTNVSTSSLALTLLHPTALATGSPSGDLDSDALIDPGEVWRWLLATPINLDCTTLSVDGYMKGAASNLYGVVATSGPVRIGSPTDACPAPPTVEEAPPVTSHVMSSTPAQSPPATSTTTTTLFPASGVLPATGRSDDRSTLLGAGGLIAGALLVIVSRRREQQFGRRRQSND
jgi:LPXTG-motif cell wall-anchored protein